MEQPLAPELPARYLLPPPRRGRFYRHTIVRVALFLAVACVLWVGGDLVYVTAGAEIDHAAPADVILVLGCGPYGPHAGPSDCLRARADHAADLYKSGFAGSIIASGGSTEGGPAEADVLRQVLVSEGVPSEAVYEEDQSLNTIQNIENSARIMGQHSWRTAILVTEPYHINRAALIARDGGLLVYPSPAVDSPLWRDPDLRRLKLAKDTLSLMLYQLKVATGTRE